MLLFILSATFNSQQDSHEQFHQHTGGKGGNQCAFADADYRVEIVEGYNSSHRYQRPIEYDLHLAEVKMPVYSYSIDQALTGQHDHAAQQLTRDADAHGNAAAGQHCDVLRIRYGKQTAEHVHKKIDESAENKRHRQLQHLYPLKSAPKYYRLQYKHHRADDEIEFADAERPCQAQHVRYAGYGRCAEAALDDQHYPHRHEYQSY